MFCAVLIGSCLLLSVSVLVVGVVEVGSGRRVFRTSDERNSTYIQPIKDVRSLDSYWLIYMGSD